MADPQGYKKVYSKDGYKKSTDLVKNINNTNTKVQNFVNAKVSVKVSVNINNLEIQNKRKEKIFNQVQTYQVEDYKSVKFNNPLEELLKHKDLIDKSEKISSIMDTAVNQIEKRAANSNDIGNELAIKTMRAPAIVMRAPGTLYRFSQNPKESIAHGMTSRIRTTINKNMDDSLGNDLLRAPLKLVDKIKHTKKTIGLTKKAAEKVTKVIKALISFIKNLPAIISSGGVILIVLIICGLFLIIVNLMAAASLHEVSISSDGTYLSSDTGISLNIGLNYAGKSEFYSDEYCGLGLQYIDNVVEKYNELSSNQKEGLTVVNKCNTDALSVARLSSIASIVQGCIKYKRYGTSASTVPTPIPASEVIAKMNEIGVLKGTISKQKVFDNYDVSYIEVQYYELTNISVNDVWEKMGYTSNDVSYKKENDILTHLEEINCGNNILLSEGFGVIWPLKDKGNRISSVFGFRNPPKTSDGYGSSAHKGIDISESDGSVITAVADGVVLDTGYQDGGAGNFISINHPQLGVVSKYFHMKESTTLKVGDNVNTGQTIGKVGSTGSSSGNHLHFGIATNNGTSYTDPLYYLFRKYVRPSSWEWPE